METIATQKFLLISPRKLRVVADLAKKMKPVDAVERLPFLHKTAGEPLVKVIKSAIVNAKQKGAVEADLIFKEIQIGEGPRLKRGRPISRGQWHPIKRRMSHIRVVLQTTNSKDQTLNSKETQKFKTDKNKRKESKS